MHTLGMSGAPQPTLRVMRLYKPALHQANTSPYLTDAPQAFPLSNFLLLPDSFGDLYMGETFRAYVAVVNTLAGKSLDKTTLSIKIQTSNTATTHELYDSLLDAGEKDLQFEETLTHVISHRIKGHLPSLRFTDFMLLNFTLLHNTHSFECNDLFISEIGTYTLRVMVQYEDREVSTTERVTIKKLYRLNVLDPLGVRATVYDSSRPHDGDCRHPVQVVVTNNSSQPMAITSVTLVQDGGAGPGVASALSARAVNAPNRQLDPDESCCVGFLASGSSLGAPRVLWEGMFGGGGVYLAEPVALPRKPVSVAPSIRVECVSAPTAAAMGDDFPLTLRVTAASSAAASGRYRLRCDASDRSCVVLGKSVYDIVFAQDALVADVPLVVCCMAQGDIDCCRAMSVVEVESATVFRVSAALVSCS